MKRRFRPHGVRHGGAVCSGAYQEIARRHLRIIMHTVTRVMVDAQMRVIDATITYFAKGTENLFVS